MDESRELLIGTEPNPVVVGIGASAGGIKALQDFFEALPEGTGAAYIVIVHLAPDVQSELAAVLAAHTAMPVVQVTGSEELKADRVYVIPPNRRLELDDHEVASAAFGEPRGQRAPVDLFYRSLSEHGDGFAIILSGAGSDGSVGVRKSRKRAGSSWCRIPMRRNTLPCRAMRSQQASPISCFPCGRLP